jgi:Zn-finger nucleic acid-binding protein
MLCPRCEVPLAALEVTARTSARRFVVDRCDSCGGMWIDRSELAPVCPALSDLQQRRIEIEAFGVHGGDLSRCPRCEKVPCAFPFVDLVIDLCLHCGGVWLDSLEQTELGAGTSTRPVALAVDGPYRALRSSAIADRIRCADCGAGTWLADAAMCGRGLICHDCYVSTLDTLDIDTSEMDGAPPADMTGPVGSFAADVIAPLAEAVSALFRGKDVVEPR